MKKMTFLAIFLMAAVTLMAQEEARMMRFPAIHGNQIVFSYAGDLYTVERSGGMARKLTSDDGYEMFARFSPDGASIAFTGQYDGNTEVYLIPARGGEPRRLTYTATLDRDDISDRMGPNNIVMTWRDNKTVVYRSRMKSFDSFKGRLYLAGVDGGLPQELPFPVGGFCSYSPDGKQFAYNRVFREFRTWKYYRGGMADEIWIYDFASKGITNISGNPAQDIFPMWAGNVIYFLSDRDRTMNLFSYDLTTKETKKLTDYTEYDIKFPSLGDNAIIYENGGYLYVFDLATGTPSKVNVTIADDFITGRSEQKDASRFITTWTLSSDGKRLGFSARGDVFTVPANTGVTRNLTQSPGVHDRNVEWSPDGKYISFISDRTGEDEIYIMNQDGKSDPVQITSGSKTYKYNPVWSPDSKKLAWSDKLQVLQYVDIETKLVTKVEETRDGEYDDYTWSPDSRWLAYSRPTREEMQRIIVYNLETKEKYPVTDGWYVSANPSFSRDGKYLFFVSSRDFNPVYSWLEWNTAYNDMNRVYFVTLTKKVENPLKPVDDEVELPDSKKGDKKDEAAKDTAKVKVTLDAEGILDRIVALPVRAGNYWGVTATEDKVYYCMRSSADNKATLKMYDLKSKKENELGDYASYIISADRKKMALHSGDKYAVIDLPSSKISVETWADLSNMKTWVNLREEWRQIFDEAWRQMRDFFYDPNMHGVDWKAMHDKYAPLVSHINNRNDLAYIIGEMIGELSTGHAYVGGGDRSSPKRIKLGLLGAELGKDASGYFKINKILRGENWTPAFRSPLTEVGMGVKEGDYIIAIDGDPVKDLPDLSVLLVDKANKQVELTVSSTNSGKESRNVIVVPTDDESQLYYFNWVQRNTEMVNRATNGQIGYIHIPDMGTEGLNEFVKHFYPQLMKRGLIIDDRSNGGGNVSPMIIERLRRELTHMGMGRNMSQRTVPDQMVVGPKVMLIDCYSASDGDLFPYQFKKLKLGKLIGTRTWGGVVGIRGSLPFVDGGFLNRPEFAHYDAEGKEFIIEGHGVDPDIVVDNDPAREYEGTDDQLNKAIEVIMEELKNYPEGWPPIPPFPDKSK